VTGSMTLTQSFVSKTWLLRTSTKMHKIQYSRISIILIPLLLVISGCKPATAPLVPTATTVPVQPGYGYAIPLVTTPGLADAYAAPDKQPASTLAPGILPETPKDIPQPDPGKSSLSGTIFSTVHSQVVAETAAYLTPGWGDKKEDPPIMIVGVRPQFGDISFRTDPNGQFTINNIPPGTYYLVVWAPYDWILGQKTSKNDDLLKITIKADQKLPLGVVYVPWG
jgi:hypothetical protein